jgi:hypothetical protein
MAIDQSTLEDERALRRIIAELATLDPEAVSVLHVAAQCILEAARTRWDAKHQHEAFVQQLLKETAWRAAVKNPAVFELGRRKKKGGR